MVVGPVGDVLGAAAFRRVPTADEHPAVISVFTLGARGFCTGVVIRGIGPLSARHAFRGFDDPRSVVGQRARVRSVTHVIELSVVAELPELDLVALSPIQGHASLDLGAMPPDGHRFLAVGVGRSSAPPARTSSGTSRIARSTANEFLAEPDPDIACDGDSGGPALVDGAVFGIASGYPGGCGGAECCGQPVQYSRLDGPLARAWLRTLRPAH